MTLFQKLLFKGKRRGGDLRTVAQESDESDLCNSSEAHRGSVVHCLVRKLIHHATMACWWPET